ncbi:MAG: hypothetical protein QXI12_13425, partial [Candidatus Methanomethyliaceae archaeon]
MKHERARRPAALFLPLLLAGIAGLAALSFLALGLPAAQAQIPQTASALIVLTPTADACVLEGYPTRNLGNTADMWVGYDDFLSPPGKIARAYIAFPSPAIPAGQQVITATL